MSEYPNLIWLDNLPDGWEALYRTLLADLAEAIETIARDCVEMQDTPEEALEHIVRLRPLFGETLTLLEREANPIVARKPVAGGGFGRRAIPTGFGED